MELLSKPCVIIRYSGVRYLARRYSVGLNRRAELTCLVVGSDLGDSHGSLVGSVVIGPDTGFSFGDSFGIRCVGVNCGNFGSLGATIGSNRCFLCVMLLAVSAQLEVSHTPFVLKRSLR